MAQVNDRFPAPRRQRRQEVEEVAPLVGGLGPGNGLLGRGDIAVQRLAQVMNDQHPDHPVHVYLGELVGQDHRHQAQAPGVRRDGLRFAGRGPPASLGGLKPLGLLKERDETGEIIHGRRIPEE